MEKKIDATVNDLVPKGGGIPSKQAIYAYISQFTQEAIDVIVEIMRTTRNENVKLGAAKVITDKSIADQKAIEVGGLNGEPIKFNIIFGNGYIPPTLKSNVASEGSIVSGQPQVQDNCMAQTCQKNDNGNNGIDQTSTG